MIKVKSIFYSILRPYATALHRLYYEELHVEGIENLPKNNAFVIAPNHQNALMDALAIVCTIPQQPVFLARADIFKKRFIAFLLNKLRILPIYRIRDGKESLSKNEEIFDQTTKILAKGVPIGLFPEATHTNKRALLPFKKGVPRIAFQAEEVSNNTLNLKIVPVGIYYSHYYKFRSILEVRFGEAFEIAPYYKMYLENQQKAMLALRDEMERRIQPLVINITNKEYYNVVDSLRTLSRNYFLKTENKKATPGNRFETDKNLVESILKFAKEKPDEMKILADKTKDYESGLKKLNLRNWLFDKEFSYDSVFMKILIYILLSPIALFGLITNYIPYKLPQLAVKNIKDFQFHSSVKFGISLFLVPIWYVIVIIVLAKTIPYQNLNIALDMSLPIVGMISFYYFRNSPKISGMLRFLKLKKKGSKSFLELSKLREEIFSQISRIIQK